MRARVALLQVRPLHDKEVGQAQVVEDAARHGEARHPADALHIDHGHVFDAEDLVKEKGV